MSPEPEDEVPQAPPLSEAQIKTSELSDTSSR